MSFIKKTLASGLSQRILIGPNQRFVFIYHDISEPGSAQYSEHYSTTAGRLREQLEFLAKHFTLVSLEEILSPQRDRKRERLAAITFDDGFLSAKEIAFPYLVSQRIPFTLFVNRLAITENRLLNEFDPSAAARSSSEKTFLDEADLRSLSRAGVPIGSHSSTHRALVNCDEAMLRHEIDDNKAYLEQLIEKPVRYLALPFGKREHYNQRVLDHSFRAGHEYVFTSNPACFDLKSSAFHQRLIPRVGLTNQSLGELVFKINLPLVKTVNF
jgi:peptidoglycan/xylan/chitin deacetylase (PgdA/CDA1 family)